MSEPQVSSACVDEWFVADGEAPTGRPVSHDALKGHGPGELLAGKYEMMALLGEGGMGCVWLAHSLLLDADVAIKVLQRQHVDDPHAADRLRREAQAIASLVHPAIVRVFDYVETADGEPFLVMEFLDGTSLADWLDERGRMSPEQAVQMLLPIADGLATAHAQGIVHRDIKPANIIVVPNGEGRYLPKIFDFGIAQVPKRGREVLTQEGMIVGSLEYMSPEQAEGKVAVGEQTDVWAFCVVLYELLTARRPFDGETLSAIVFALYSCKPTPTTELGGGDAELWAIIERGLQRSPAARWPTMRALGQALAAWAVERDIATDAAGTSIAHHWLASASPSSTPPPSSPRRPVMTGLTKTKNAQRGEPLSGGLYGRNGTAVYTLQKVLRAPSRMKALFGGAALVLCILPVDFVACHEDHLARATVGETAALIAASPSEPARVALEMPIVLATPHVEPIAAVTAEASPNANSTRHAPPRTAGTARQKRATPGMPLPASPEY